MSTRTLSREELSDEISHLEGRALIVDKTTSKYRPVSSHALVGVVQTAIERIGQTATVSFSAPRGRVSTNHIIRFTLSTPVQFMGDTVYPQILVFNSLNAESALQVKVGFYRIVCSNGLIVGNSFFSERIVHVVGETTERRLAELDTKVAAALQFIATKLAGMETALQAQLDWDSELRIVRGLGLSQRLTDQIEARINPANRSRLLRNADQGQNVWSLYNVINEAIRRNSRSPFRNDIRNVELMDQVIELAAA